MGTQNVRWSFLGALLTAAAAMAVGCVTESGSDPAPLPSDGGAGGTGGTEETGGTGGSDVEEGGAGGAEPATAGSAGAEATAGAAGAEATGGTAGAEPTAGAGGAAAGAGGAAAGAGGQSCLGDTWSEQPDCSALPGADLLCQEEAAGGAGGAGGAGNLGGAAGAVGYKPLGVEDCEWFVENARRGFAEGYHACVAALDETPCSAAYDSAVDDCLDSVTDRVCDSPEAESNCAQIECSELEAGLCLDVLKIYPPEYQETIVQCFQAGAGDVAGCRDEFLDCE